MTKKKEEKKEKSKKNPNINSDNSEQNEGDVMTEPELEEKESETAKSKKVELLEEKEGAGLQIEYFSKEDLIKQINDLKETLKKKDEEIKNLDGWKDKYMRLQAEFENTQKRWDKNREYLRSQYTAAVLKNLLPLYDSFKKAIDSSPKKEQLEQFFNQFMNILKFEGAEPMATKVNDSYDYNFHEALTTIERDDIEENRILDIIQEGWKYKKEVLRYAKVVISKKPKPLEPESEEEMQPEKVKKEEIPKDSSESKNENNSTSNENN